MLWNIPFWSQFSSWAENNPKIFKDFLKSPEKKNMYIATALGKVYKVDNFSIFYIETIPTTFGLLVDLSCLATWWKSRVTKKKRKERKKSKWNCTKDAGKRPVFGVLKLDSS